MNKIALATCVLGVLGLASTARAASPCVELLVKGLGSLSVPEPIVDFIASVESELPADEDGGWNGLPDSERLKFMPTFPVLSCDRFKDTMRPILEKLFSQDKLCAVELEENEETLKEARAHAVLGPLMKAREACFDFEPHTRDEGLMI